MGLRLPVRSCFTTLVAALALQITLFAGLAAAQDRPMPLAEFSAGWVGFVDDYVVSEAQFGAAFRYYLTPRTGVGPELTYIEGENHSHFMLTGTVMWDLVPTTGMRPRRLIPFLAAGGGLYQTRESFTTSFTSSEGTFTVGGGVRAAAGDRVTFGVDARFGWEPHVRVAGVLGVRLGR